MASTCSCRSLRILPEDSLSGGGSLMALALIANWSAAAKGGASNGRRQGDMVSPALLQCNRRRPGSNHRLPRSQLACASGHTALCGRLDQCICEPPCPHSILKIAAPQHQSWPFPLSYASLSYQISLSMGEVVQSSRRSSRHICLAHQALFA